MQTFGRPGRSLFFIMTLVIIALLSITISALAASPGQISSPPSVTLSPEILAGIAGAVLSLAFSYIPGLNAKFAAQPDETKKLIMAVLLLLCALSIYGLGCAGVLIIGFTCDQQGFIQLIWLFILSIMANQGVYKLTPQTGAVKAAKTPPPTNG